MDLKIRDDVDLKELEKFGFVEGAEEHNRKLEMKIVAKLIEQSQQIAELKAEVKRVTNIKNYETKKLLNKRAKLKKQLAETETALELACEKLPMEYEYCSSHPERYNLQDEYGSDEPYWVEEGGCEFDDPAKCLECVVNYFKTRAKELIDG